jgi:hypothetical protein
MYNSIIRGNFNFFKSFKRRCSPLEVVQQSAPNLASHNILDIWCMLKTRFYSSNSRICKAAQHEPRVENSVLLLHELALCCCCAAWGRQKISLPSHTSLQKSLPFDTNAPLKQGFPIQAARHEPHMEYRAVHEFATEHNERVCCHALARAKDLRPKSHLSFKYLKKQLTCAATCGAEPIRNECT